MQLLDSSAKSKILLPKMLLMMPKAIATQLKRSEVLLSQLSRQFRVTRQMLILMYQMLLDMSKKFKMLILMLPMLAILLMRVIWRH